MLQFKKYIVITTVICLCQTLSAQINEAKLGAWYMYFWNTTIKESSWGFQGDIQYRNWNTIGDLEQLLLRGGLTYQPKNVNVKFTLGYGHIQTGVYGESNNTSLENRIYQEALVPNKLSERITLTHRFRYEQRFVEGQSIRTRYRYNLFANFILANLGEESKTLYLALYNEVFLNGERNIGNGKNVEVFDRNRLYAAIGYQPLKNLKIQVGVMQQSTDSWSKLQKQLSLHHSF